MKGTLYEDRYKFMIAFPSVILRMKKNFQTKFVEKIKTHILYLLAIFVLENGAVYEIMWKIILQPGRPQMAT